eukprot:scaffold240_cov243-Pinguiococcus_pyrenoidosus.AAC.26
MQTLPAEDIHAKLRGPQRPLAAMLLPRKVPLASNLSAVGQRVSDEPVSEAKKQMVRNPAQQVASIRLVLGEQDLHVGRSPRRRPGIGESRDRQIHFRQDGLLVGHRRAVQGPEVLRHARSGRKRLHVGQALALVTDLKAQLRPELRPLAQSPSSPSLRHGLRHETGSCTTSSIDAPGKGAA